MSLTADDLDAQARRHLAFVSFCYDKAQIWQRLGQYHSERARQLENRLMQERGWLAPEKVEE